MGRTALDLTQQEWQAYQPGSAVTWQPTTERWERAWEVACQAARLLRSRFGATRVVAFGSLVHREWFSPWSDVDLAAWGIESDVFFRAVAAVSGLSAEFRVDLVAPEDCQPALLRAIEQEGVPL